MVMESLGGAAACSLWVRIPLLIAVLVIFNGERDSGAGAHSFIGLHRCLFNSTGDWVFLEQHVYDKELMAYYDYNQKKYIAVKAWMQSNVDRFNRESAEAKYQEGTAYCEHNIPIMYETALARQVKPKVTIQTKESAHPGPSAILICYAVGFYPAKISVTWLKNGQKVSDADVTFELLSNGDWTYQVRQYLQYEPVYGDKYTCHVEHSSLTSPMRVDWEVESTTKSEKTKIIVGVLGFVFGLIILLAGVIMRLKNAKAILDSNHGPRLMGPAVS
ncbi:SLA class II histocompatibility antigen, DQ haplotype D beta chain-like [Stegostoma tigrinum]|uniref:SLA class II histocompatibility antigen, DQ haplotype D beta chain-like n=1 Tax=Stegostoma tigrinum TaxID=3053191 RepID=UPI002870401C|nr:SLA class II histocompatibility antigen, DQ haplotype D beta chain-like [Stegostoma tigrinum]